MPMLVSIITPTYNHEKVLRDCIESVLAQTYSQWEMIIIDDGSEDNTPRVAQVYSNSDPRIRYIRQEHRGLKHLAETYNAALSRAKGDLVAILEGDDFWPANKLALQVPTHEKNRLVKLSYGPVWITDSHARILTKWEPRVSKNVLNNNPPGIMARHILQGGPFPHSSTYLIRRDALERIGGFQGTMVVDGPTLMRISLEGKFCYLNTPLGYRRYHISSVTANNEIWLQLRETGERYDVNFLRSHKKNKEVSKVTESDIIRKWQRITASQYLHRGEVLLALGHRWLALRYFHFALFHSSLRTRLAAGIGILSAFTGINLLDFVRQHQRGWRVQVQ